MADAKFVIIDWNSLFYMLKNLGIGKIKDPVLFNILTKEVGEASRCFGKPVLVLWSDQVKNNTRAKYLEKVVGYEVVGVEKKKGGEDDLEIIKRVEALSPKDVSEIILVSSDIMDFLSCLRAQIALGIKVWLVASKTTNSEGKSMLTSMVDLPSENIQFVELGEYSERIIREAWIEKEKAAPNAPTESATAGADKKGESAVKQDDSTIPVRTIKLSLEVAENDFDSGLAAITQVLQMAIFSKAVLEIK